MPLKFHVAAKNLMSDGLLDMGVGGALNLSEPALYVAVDSSGFAATTMLPMLGDVGDVALFLDYSANQLSSPVCQVRHRA